MYSKSQQHFMGVVGWQKYSMCNSPSTSLSLMIFLDNPSIWGGFLWVLFAADPLVNPLLGCTHLLDWGKKKVHPTQNNHSSKEAHLKTNILGTYAKFWWGIFDFKSPQLTTREAHCCERNVGNGAFVKWPRFWNETSDASCADAKLCGGTCVWLNENTHMYVYKYIYMM